MGNKDQYGLAGLIAGVPRFRIEDNLTLVPDNENGNWITVNEVLAALEAATLPDLVATDANLLSELERAMVPYDPEVDAQEYWEALCCRAKSRIEALIALATAQQAQIAGFEAFIRNDADWKFSAKRRLELFHEQRARAEAAEAEAHACGAERERWKERAEAAEAEAATLRAEHDAWKAQCEAVQREAAKCFSAQEEIEAAWDAFGTSGNRQVLTLAEQIASHQREVDDARAALAKLEGKTNV